MAILLTAEGSTLLIIWNEIVQNFDWMNNNLWDPSWFSTSQEFASSLVTNLTDFDNRFKLKVLKDSYDYSAAAANITKFNISTTEGYDKVEDIYNDMLTALTVFVFDNFDVEPPADLNAPKSEADTADALFTVFVTVFLYFLISAGCLLVILGVMYWFGKTHKSRWEYGSIVVRAVVGIALSLVAISSLYNTGLRLFLSPWMIPMVTIVYFLRESPLPTM